MDPLQYSTKYPHILLNMLPTKNKEMYFDPIQSKAIERFSKYGCGLRTFGTLLLHKVGTGKTISALLIALNNLEPSDKVIDIIIVAPVGIFNNFVDDLQMILGRNKKKEKDKSEAEKEDIKKQYNVTDGTIEISEFQTGIKVKLIEYDYDSLINDLNNKKIAHDFTGKIVIFDEAHRLLSKQLYNSIEASFVMGRHNFLDDKYFVNSIYQAKNIIVLTGTPMQTSVADLCRFGNFLNKTTNYTLAKYASRGFRPASIIFLARHWKSIVGFAATFGTEAFTYVLGKASDLDGPYLGMLKYLAPSIIGIFMTYALSKPMYTKGLRGILYNDKNESTDGGSKKHNSTIKKNTKKHQKNNKITLKGGKPGDIELITSFLQATSTVLMTSVKKTYLDPKNLVVSFYTDPTMTDIQGIINDIEEPYYNVEMLAEDLSVCISVYDYEIQDKTCDVNTMELTPEVKESELALNFPLEMPFRVELNYDDDQLLLQYKYNLGILSFEEKTLFYNLGKFDKVDLDVNRNQIEFLKTCKFVGNFSNDMLKYYTKLDTSEEGKKQFCSYQLLDRNSSQGNMSTGLKGEEVTSNNVFECPKFLDVRKKLDFLKDNLFLCDGEGEATTTRQAHISTERYLPLIYSTNEDFGTSLFACYLNSIGSKYILIHKSQKGQSYESYFEFCQTAGFITPVHAQKINTMNPKLPDLLEFCKYLAFECTYALNADNSVPTCIILDPTMTEGLNAKYNPAIFVLEPCNSFGDHDQVYGRVLRKYSKDDLKNVLWVNNFFIDNNNLPRFPKAIYQYTIIEKKDVKKFTDQLTALKDRIVDLFSTKVGVVNVSFNPTEYVVSALKFKFTYPDAYSMRKIEREKANLQAFEKKVRYNVFCSDIRITKDCREGTTFEEYKEGKRDKRSDGEKVFDYVKTQGGIIQSHIFKNVELATEYATQVSNLFANSPEKIEEEYIAIPEFNGQETLSEALQDEEPPNVKKYDKLVNAELCYLMSKDIKNGHGNKKHYDEVCAVTETEKMSEYEEEGFERPDLFVEGEDDVVGEVVPIEIPRNTNDSEGNKGSPTGITELNSPTDENDGWTQVTKKKKGGTRKNLNKRNKRNKKSKAKREKIFNF